MNLCHYSKSAILQRLILTTCPLDLNSSEAAKCPCRKREYGVPPSDLRVLSCTFPNNWRGEAIRSPEALGNSLRANRRQPKQAKQPKQEPKRERSTRTMTTATATAPAVSPTNAGANGHASDKFPADGTARPGTVIAMYDRITDPMDFINKMSLTLYESKMFGCENRAMAQVLAYRFLVRREDPFDFVRRNDIIGGKVSMKSATMLADFRTKCGGSHRVLSHTPDKAAIELKIGKEKQIFEFTWEDAQREDYVYTKDAVNGKTPKLLPNNEANPAALKDNWSTPRRRSQMMWARVVSDGVRVMAPEVNYGMYTPEELGGPADEVGDDNVVDGEFTVASEPANAATANATAPAQQQQPANDTPAADPPPTQQATAAAPAASTAQIPAGGNPTHDEQGVPYAVSKDKLRVLKELKDRLLTDDQWAKVLAKYGVTKAGQLNAEQADKIHEALLKRQQKVDEEAVAAQANEGDDASF